MRKLRILGIAALLATAGVAALAASQPDVFRVQRTIVVAAPPAKVFPLVDDFRRWGAWSPFEKLDPAMKRTFGATASGEGASYAWDGNGKAGAGRMEIVRSRAHSAIDVALHFRRPLENDAKATFRFAPEAGGTRVTWTMESPSPFIAKVMHVFLDAEAMVGADFARGLADLKALAEAPAS
jgi:uncharacterized protein YndB with AHSA1/START domain